MEAKLGRAEKKALRIANLLDDAADEIRKRSKRAYREGRMSLEEYMEARAKELELRAKVSMVVATDIGDVLNETSSAGKSIEEAIRDAKARIAAGKSIKNGLKIVAALVSLAGALVLGDVQLVLKAGKEVAGLTQ